mgnify:CR=1 FL=1
MSKNLVIVESPEKAKTIQKFLDTDYNVLSSKGHIRDIEGIGKNSMGIDFEHQYRPNYVIDPKKHALLQTLQKEAQAAQTVWLASDEDREGEAIAWHLQEVLHLDKSRTHRIAFHEITKSAIQEAIRNPRDIDRNLVNAQQARRVLDRIVGFELSPILWRKVTTGLSAGRVQSVAVRLIVDREREIEEFVESAQYRITADFIGRNEDGQDVAIKTELNHRFPKKEDAVDFLQRCNVANFSVQNIQTKPVRHTPAPPFTTSSLQQEAARKLKFSVSKTMRLAQSLYEAGHITYMRTDSVNLSSLAINTTKNEIIHDANLGVRYHQARHYHTSTKGAQEAHEAIRPTFMNIHSAGQTADEKRLYDLIWRRTLACQMADAEGESTRIEIGAPTLPYLFVAVGETILFDGFMRAYVQSSDEEQDNNCALLPHINEGVALTTHEIIAQQAFTKAPFRYTEASLVKKMEELGIGRPSTYATIIETIQTRHYVERGNIPGKKHEYNVLAMKNGHLTDKTRQELYGQDSQKLLPTDLGRITNDFLVEHFPEILSYDFTAHEEENFDSIALGKADWIETVDEFYKRFHPMVTKVSSGKVSARKIGIDPESGEPVWAKISKIGPCIQIGESDHGKPRFASLKKGQSLFTITLEEALQLFAELHPHTIMTIDGDEVVAAEGKFGPYIKYRNQYYSVPKNMNLSTLTEQDVHTLIEEQLKASKPLKTFDGMQIFQGRYGAYIKTADGNIRIPRSINLNTLTQEECLTIIANSKSPKTHVRHHS